MSILDDLGLGSLGGGGGGGGGGLDIGSIIAAVTAATRSSRSMADVAQSQVVYQQYLQGNRPSLVRIWRRQIMRLLQKGVPYSQIMRYMAPRVPKNLQDELQLAGGESVLASPAMAELEITGGIDTYGGNVAQSPQEAIQMIDSRIDQLRRTHPMDYGYPGGWKQEIKDLRKRLRDLRRGLT